MEDKIQKLCQEICAAKDDTEQTEKLVELRRLLHLHIEQLRAKVSHYPLIVQRRKGPLADETPSEGN